jgi:hypothetical protein
MVMFYLFVLACIKKELQYISSSLADLRHKEVMNITTGLEDIRQQHQSIVNLLSSVNPILQHVDISMHTSLFIPAPLNVKTNIPTIFPRIVNIIL